ncbi:MAG: UDP-N-acetyl-D-glucosamine 2-epimerase, UDP-hydrolysing [Deltaproteobacteria bacterium RIFCSPLOWO2_02_FULL_46_8]|nr:MAG: UDP-N-acetyl-D-glucosamine 2-epimerase, UDP-hydrolysing [Deltaproteobacteria bacterium RIFCSPLOWO2_02_FULL_46_8]
MKTVGVITVGRSDYGIYRPVLRSIQSHPDLKLHLIVAGTHLLSRFGSTIEEIQNDGFPIGERVNFPLENDSPEGIAQTMGAAVGSFARSYNRFRPDILLVLGDRFEMHAAVLAALPFKIPVAHIHGGELTYGAFDNALRHSITMFSHLHFAATEIYRQRILQLGEEPWRVHLTGAPALDALVNFKPMALEDLARHFDLPLTQAPILVTYHPVTLEYENTTWQIDQLLASLSDFPQPIVFTGPNADTHNSIIGDKIRSFVRARKNAHLVVNFGSDYYFHMLANAKVMVGNSSSGLLEAPSFALPVVNIGSRQEGRIRAKNVIDVGYSKEKIVSGIQKALSASFRDSLQGMHNPCDAGGAATKITECLKTVSLDPKLVFKRFVDHEVRLK